MNSERHDEMMRITEEVLSAYTSFRFFIEKNSSLVSQSVLFVEQKYEKKEHVNQHKNTNTINNGFKFDLLEKRLKAKRPLLKAFFSAKVYHYLCNISLEDALDHKLYNQLIPLMMEVIMTIQYYENQFLDGKGGVTTHHLVEANRNLGVSLRMLSIEYLKEYPAIAEGQRRIIIKYFEEILRVVEYGQWTERYNNLYENYYTNLYKFGWGTGMLKKLDNEVIEHVQSIIIKNVPELNNKIDFLSWYLKRIFFAGAYTYIGIVHMLSDLLNAQKKDTPLLKFAAYYGMLMQIVNDLTDFVPTDYNAPNTTKDKSDTFNDLKTKNVTLPILVYLVSSNKDSLLKKKLVAEESELLEVEEYEILHELISSKTIDKTLDICIQIKEHIISVLDKENINTSLLNNLCDVVHTNKFTNFLRKYLHSEYKP